MRLSELFTDANGLHLSHTKLWANIAYASATGAFIYGAWQNQLSADIWLIYLGVVGGAATASKFLSLRYGSNGAQQEEAPATQPTVAAATPAKVTKPVTTTKVAPKVDDLYLDEGSARATAD